MDKLNLPTVIYDTNFEEKLLEVMRTISVKENKFTFLSYDSIANLIGEKLYDIKNFEGKDPHISWAGHEATALNDDPWMYLGDGILFQIGIAMLSEEIIYNSNYILELSFKNNDLVTVDSSRNEVGEQFGSHMKKFLIDRIKFDITSRKSISWKDGIDLLMKLKEIRDEPLFSYKILFEIPEIKK